ncbi:MAG: ECF transporter S component [Acutalibacteraceae bacterium]
MTDSKNKVQRLVGTSILAAIIIVLQVITTYFPTKPFAITLAMIPIVIGAAVYGEKAGAVLGGIFSIVVIAMCIFGVDVGGAMVWNANPFLCILVCLLKGVAAGYIAGLVYRLLSKKSVLLGTVTAAIAAPIVNTGIFILGLSICFRPLLYSWAGESDVLYYVIFGLTGINFLVELGVNIIVSPIIVKILKAIKVAK